MSESFTVRHRSDRVIEWTDDHDWLGEFASEPAPKSRLLTEVDTLPVITSKAPPKYRQGVRGPGRNGTRLYSSILLVACALLLLMVSASTVGVWQWMRVALTPLPVAEWAVASPATGPATSTIPNPAKDSVERELARETAPAVAAPIPPSQPSATPTEFKQATAAAPAAGTGPAVRRAPSDSAPVSTGNEVADVLSVLERYRLAFSSLNPGSVRTVWPSADTRALTRQFAAVKRQTFAFDNCRIDVQGVHAEAICDGRISLVTKGSSAEASIQTRRWMFTLAYQTNAWKIRTVVTSPTPPLD